MHIKAVDVAGHEKSAPLKIEMLEKTDQELKHLISLLEADSKHEYIICCTGDHSTPIKIGDHTYQPVPMSITYLRNLKEDYSHPVLSKL